LRFFVTQDIRRNDLLRLIVVLTIVFFFFFWVTNLLLYLKIGFTYNSIVKYYRGSEETFQSPKSYAGMLEEAHFHFFSMAIILVTLNHLFLFTPIKSFWKLVVILASFLSAFGDISGGWLILYVSPLFAYLKIASVIILQVSLALLLIAVLSFLYGRRKTADLSE